MALPLTELADAIVKHEKAASRHHNALEVYLMQVTMGRRKLDGEGFAACEAELSDAHYELVMSLGRLAVRLGLGPRL